MTIRDCTRVCWCLLLAISLSGCGADAGTQLSSDWGPSQPTSMQQPSPAVAASGGMLYFPQQASTAEQRGKMAALLTGRLVDHNNCLQVDDTNSESIYLIIWPPEVQLTHELGRAVVVDTAGQLVAKVGDDIALGGGEITTREALAAIAQPLSQPVPAACPGPFWLVGDIVPQPQP